MWRAFVPRSAYGRNVYRAARLACAGAALPVLSSCADGSNGAYVGTTSRVGKDLATVYVNNAEEPEYLDPGKAADSGSVALIAQLFEGLTSFAVGDLHPVQGVATRWEQSDDNRIFRFHLRPDARWSDGKPVTAHDFEYSWKRTLRPSTASLAASNLHALKNGELFNQGKLKAVREATVLRGGPQPDAEPLLSLAKGAFVVVLAHSPAKLGTRIAPLATPPDGVRGVIYTEPDDGAAEQLALETGSGSTLAPLGPAPDGGWAGAVADIVQLGPPVSCNNAPDRWYALARPDGARGYLPGCLLSAVEEPSSAVVVPHESLPTYDPRAPKPAAASPRSIAGFLPAAVLLEDDKAVGVRAKDDLTLDVELEQPTPFFIDLTSYPTLYPVRRDVVESFEARGEPELWFRPENIVVNGPYILEDWKFRYEITMKRNPMYWDHDRLKVHRIVWLEVAQNNATMQLFKAGELDYMGDNAMVPAEHLEGLSSKKDFRLTDYLSTYWYELNTKKPPLDDVRVRWALNLAIDKQALVDKIARLGRAALHYVPDYTGSGYAGEAAADRERGEDPFSPAEVGYNPERARALLAEAGYEIAVADGEVRAKGFPPVEILYNTGEAHRLVAVAVQDMWKRNLGISVTLRSEEWKVMLKNMRDGHFQVVRSGWVADYNHPQTWLGTFLSYNPQNQTGWTDKEFDEMVKLAAATRDPDEGIRIFRKAEKRALDGMSKLPLLFEAKATLIKPWVKGFHPNVRSLTLMKWLWIDPNWQNNPTNDVAFPELALPVPGRLVAAGGGAP